MGKTKNIRAADYKESYESKNSSVLGTFEGECADATITNLNGLDITREVWENVFASEEYQRGIKYGWFIGFLGHPEDDPDCQDFEHGCIVMREGHIDENGKVYGKFDLVDTPVGRIVRAFQDAGVTFGISVRGAGDIIQNSVDPETFIFRGFDLVAFPAFPESIPTFKQIAASSDATQRQKYQAVCSAVKTNIDSLNTVESVEIVQSCFAEQSDEYQMLEDQKKKLQSSGDSDQLKTVADIIGEEDSDEIDPRVDSMTKLYLDLKDKYDTLQMAHGALQSMYDNIIQDNARKLESIERITSSQINDLNKVLSTVEASLRIKTNEVKSLRKEVVAQTQLKKQLQEVKASLDTHIEANNSLREDIRRLNKDLTNQKEENLKYKKKVEAAQDTIKSKEAIISSVKSELDETVRKHAQELASANRADEIASMKSKVTAAESLLKDYQDAYANMYASAVGVRLPNLRVTSNTSVDNLQRMIRASVSLPMKPDFLEPTQEVDPSYFDAADYDEDALVTL